MSKDLFSTSAKKSFRKFFALLCAAASVFFILCGIDESDTDAKAGGYNEKINIDSRFNEAALFLAGKEMPKKSSLYQYSQAKEYKAYSQQIDSAWRRLQDFNEKKITLWREKHLPKAYTGDIFYPFSGPDILNALLFFPYGIDYIMFGLESPGGIAQPHSMTNDKLRSGLNGLWEALDSILGVNFFKTIDMGKKISTHEFNSVTSVIMFFLGRMDYEVLEVKRIWIDENGAVTSLKPEKKSNKTVPGSIVIFRKAQGKPVQMALYYQIDVSDGSLNVRKNFISYLKSQGRFTTIIKSASYLMHREKEFSQIRSLILSQSDYLLQDDSGIPLKYFPQKEWQLSFYGIYTKPIKLFAERYQADLNQASKKYSAGPLDFSYGYNFQEHNHNLMFAERIKK